MLKDNHTVLNPDPLAGLTPEEIAALGVNLTGYQKGVTEWKGGKRSLPWQPPEFLQNYGNYTGMFPSMGQQVGQSLYGSIQGQNYQPAWMQTQLPPRLQRSRNMGMYSPFQSGLRDMTNPYPLNGKVNLTTPNIGPVSNASNPFIGAYQGLTGFPGNGPNVPPPPGGTGLPPPPGGTGTPPPPGGTGLPPAPGGTGTPPTVPTPATNPYNKPYGGMVGNQATGIMPPFPGTPGPMLPPRMPTITEPAPGTGGPEFPGTSLPGAPYGQPATSPYATISKLMSSLSPQTMQGLLGLFGGLKK